MTRQTRKVIKESCQDFFKQRSVRKDEYFDRETLQFYNQFYNLLIYLRGDPIVQEPASSITADNRRMNKKVLTFDILSLGTVLKRKGKILQNPAIEGN